MRGTESEITFVIKLKVGAAGPFNLPDVRLGLSGGEVHTRIETRCDDPDHVEGHLKVILKSHMWIFEHSRAGPPSDTPCNA